MQRAAVSDLSAFVAVATHRSFSRAAAELGLSPSALSHTVRSLEERLDLRLLNRTTRSVAPTEAGERLLERLRPALRDIDDALEDANAFRAKPAGRLGRVDRQPVQDGSKTPPVGLASVAWGGSTLHPS